MIRSTGALLLRACREDARLVQSHLFRMFFAVAVIGAFIIAIFVDRPLGAPGLLVFRWICWINAVSITFGAISFFSTVITEEKEELTLGLLQMTGMSPLALLLGKSTSRLIVAVLALCVQFPFVLLAITLGGILWHQIASAYLALLAYLICVANLGLFASVRCRDSGGAAGLMCLIFGAFYGGVPLAQWKLVDLVKTGVLSPSGWIVTSSKELLDRCHELNIFTQINTCVATGFVASTLGEYEIWTNVVAGLVCFLLAWAMFECCTAPEQLSRSPSPSHFGFVKRSRATPRRAWRNAFAWKDFCFVAGGMRLTLSKFVLYGLLGAGLVWYFPAEFDLLAMPMMIVATALEAVIFASRVFSHEAREKTLPLLKVLPVSWFSTCWSKIGGCLIGIVPAICYLGGTVWLWERAHGNDPIGSAESLCDPRYWLLPLTILLLIHLTAYLSLVIKHGAIVVALLAVWCSFAVLEMLYFHGRFPPLTPIPVLFVSIVVAFSLHALAVGESRKFAAQRYEIHVGIFVAAATAFYFGYQIAVAVYSARSSRWPSDEKVFLADVTLVPIMIALQFLIARRLRKIAAS